MNFCIYKIYIYIYIYIYISLYILCIPSFRPLVYAFYLSIFIFFYIKLTRGIYMIPNPSTPALSASASPIFEDWQTGFYGEAPEDEENPLQKVIGDAYSYFNKPTGSSVANRVPGGQSMPENRRRYFQDDVENLLGFFTEKGTDLADSVLSSTSAAGLGGNSGIPNSVFDYVNAELARTYGMDRSTAYQEALSNTAYQRAVKDMKAAGLNPAVLFGAGRGSSAGGVSYVKGSSSGKSFNGNLFSEGSYFGLSALAGLIGMALTKSPTGFWIGQSTAQGVMGALNHFKK